VPFLCLPKSSVKIRVCNLKKEFTMLVKELYKESVAAIQKDEIKTAKTTLL
jgi:hypothetical protein